jgi:hypothetical protein
MVAPKAVIASAICIPEGSKLSKNKSVLALELANAKIQISINHPRPFQEA